MKKLRKKIKIGSWITTYNPSAVHLMSLLGFKWLCIDMEHSTISFDQMEQLIAAIKNNDSVPFVRVGTNDQLHIKKALDAGAQGIIVPMVNTVKEAKNAINYTFYPPVGKRGVGLSRSSNFGYDFETYVKGESKKIQLILQIENIEGINNLDKILNLKNISGTLLGPYDLSASLGVIGKLENSLVKNAIKFLSNADLVEQWGLLKRETFFALWCITFLGLVLYIFGIIRFPHDNPKTNLNRGRVSFGVITFGFVIYLFPAYLRLVILKFLTRSLCLIMD